MAKISFKPIHRLLDAIGLKGFEELKPHERPTYERWEKMLSAETNIDELKSFLIKELAALRNAREAEDAVPGERIDQERLGQIRTIKGMLGQYVKNENLQKQAEAEIEQAINSIKQN